MNPYCSNPVKTFALRVQIKKGRGYILIIADTFSTSDHGLIHFLKQTKKKQKMKHKSLIIVTNLREIEHLHYKEEGKIHKPFPKVMDNIY